MSRSQVFRRRIAVGFGVVAFLALLISIVSFWTLSSVITNKDLIISNEARDLLQTRELQVASGEKVAAERAYLLTQDPVFLERARAARERFKNLMEVLRTDLLGSPDEEKLLDAIAHAEKAHEAAVGRAVKIEKRDQDSKEVADVFEDAVKPRREELKNAFATLLHEKETRFQDAIQGSRASAGRAMGLVGIIGAASVLLTGALSLLSARTLGALGKAESDIRVLNQNLEQRIEERTSQLRNTLTQLEDLTYTVAHDLRAPLRAMAGFSRALIEDFGDRLESTGAGYLCRIEEASRRMDRLIQDLLEYSRLPHEEIRLRPVDLSNAVGEALEAVRPEAEGRRATVKTEIPPLSVKADGSLLHRVLVQLLSNGIKFVPAGTTPAVRVRAAQHGGVARVMIEDNGIGIAPEYHERIFGVFQRLNRVEDYPGTGMGLAVARRALERMNGKIGVESEPGKGSRFWIELPVATPSPNQQF